MAKGEGLSIFQLLATIAVIGIAMAFLLPPVPVGHPPGPLVCRNNLKKIATALRSYVNVHGQYPEHCIYDKYGNPMHSWRVLILPYLDMKEVYDAYDFTQPWNSPENLALAADISEVFQCPSCEPEDSNSTHSSYMAVTGSGTAWGKRISDFDRDLSEILVVIEVPHFDVNVLEPKDISYSELQANVDTAGDTSAKFNRLDGQYGAYVDGSVKYLEGSLRGQELAELAATTDSSLQQTLPANHP